MTIQRTQQKLLTTNLHRFSEKRSTTGIAKGSATGMIPLTQIAKGKAIGSVAKIRPTQSAKGSAKGSVTKIPFTQGSKEFMLELIREGRLFIA